MGLTSGMMVPIQSFESLFPVFESISKPSKSAQGFSRPWGHPWALWSSVGFPLDSKITSTRPNPLEGVRPRSQTSVNLFLKGHSNRQAMLNVLILKTFKISPGLIHYSGGEVCHKHVFTLVGKLIDRDVFYHEWIGDIEQYQHDCPGFQSPR